MSTAIYNEIDPYAARWLRNLMFAGHIAKGTVDERSITALTPADVAGPGQRHFFAGIGVWSHALRLAGFPDSANVWTGSCPCQPWSDAGELKQHEDERDLWPAWFPLIRVGRPDIVVGEQVASNAGLGWLDVVRADLEGAGYAFGAFDLSAAGIGAPHRRQRLYFAGVRLADDDGAGRRLVCPPWLHADGERGDDAARRGAPGGSLADTNGRRRRAGKGLDEKGLSLEPGSLADAKGKRRTARRGHQPSDGSPLEPQRRGDARGVVHTDGLEPRRNAGAADRAEGEDRGEGNLDRRGGFEPLDRSADGGEAGGLGNADHEGLEGLAGAGNGVGEPRRHDEAANGSSPSPGFWSGAGWVDCRDGKRRPVEPGTFPLAHGSTARVGRLRAYGNAIVGPLAAAFLRCLRDTLIEAGR